MFSDLLTQIVKREGGNQVLNLAALYEAALFAKILDWVVRTVGLYIFCLELSINISIVNNKIQDWNEIMKV